MFYFDRNSFKMQSKDTIGRQRKGKAHDSNFDKAFLPQVTKGAEPLNPFSFAIEKRNPSKYSSTVTKKGEREKKTMLVYRGRFALLASFYAPFKT